MSYVVLHCGKSSTIKFTFQQGNVDKLVVFNILSMNIFLWLCVNAFFFLLPGMFLKLKQCTPYMYIVIYIKAKIFANSCVCVCVYIYIYIYIYICALAISLLGEYETL